MDTAIKGLAAHGLIAVMRHVPLTVLPHVVEALVNGGVHCIELTTDGDSTVPRIAALRQRFASEVVIGVGTVLSVDAVHDACDGGAEFLVSPHWDPQLMVAAKNRGVPYVPGVMTPTEVYTAISQGAPMIKLFPAAILGPRYIRELQGPFGDLPLMVTGGINEDNLQQFFDVGVLAVGLGGALVPAAAVERRDFLSIQDNARRLTDRVAQARTRRM